MEPRQRRLAERRLLAALRRLHRADPLRREVRLDAVLSAVRQDPGERLPAAHRGGGSLAGVGDAALIAVLEELVARGSVIRSGRRVRLAEHEPLIADAEMSGRVERLLAGLRETGAEPPRVDAVAARLGIPAGMVEALRQSGQLVSLGEGIDYPRDVLAALLAEVDEIAAHGPLTVSRVRDALRTSRRHAEALIAARRRQPRARGGVRRGRS